MKLNLLLCLCAALGASTFAQDAPAPAGSAAEMFAPGNLIAWSVVPYDLQKRTPPQRVEMLRRLGFTRFAYDWRLPASVADFAAELDALAGSGLALQAFWLPTRTADPVSEPHVREVLQLLGRRGMKTQLWLKLEAPPFAKIPVAERVDAVARAIRPLATEAERIGCNVGFYNHGGWLGEPALLVAVMQRLALKNTGLVYNFRHGHGDLDEFAPRFAAMQPHLLAVNLSGVKRGGPERLTLGQGDEEARLLRLIVASGYRGPFGVENAQPNTDSATTLQANLDGLRQLAAKLGQPASTTNAPASKPDAPPPARRAGPHFARPAIQPRHQQTPAPHRPRPHAAISGGAVKQLRFSNSGHADPLTWDSPANLTWDLQTNNISGSELRRAFHAERASLFQRR